MLGKQNERWGVAIFSVIIVGFFILSLMVIVFNVKRDKVYIKRVSHIQGERVWGFNNTVSPVHIKRIHWCNILYPNVFI